MPGNSASAHAWALLPGQEGDNIVQTKLGNKACLVLDLVVIAVLVAQVVAVLHLGVEVADLLLSVKAGLLLSVKAGLHLGVIAARLHLDLLGGVVEARVFPDDVAEVDLHLVLMVGEVVLSVPEVVICTELKLGG